MKNNDIPAFPFQSVNPQGIHNSPESCMTLRDYFAGMALIHASYDYQSLPAYIAERCYIFADAMLVERQRENS